MDPNETLKRIRAIIDDYNADEDGMMDATERDEMFTELVTLLEALDEWMSKGGFSPWGTTESGESIDELVEAHERGELGLDLPAG